MAQQMTQPTELIQMIKGLAGENQSAAEIRHHLIEEGYSQTEVTTAFTDIGMSKTKRPSNINNQDYTETHTMQYTEPENSLEDFFENIMSIVVIYGVPLLLMGFGLLYVWQEIMTDMNVGVRSLAAAIMPLAITLAFSRSNMRLPVSDFFTNNKLIAFGFSFAFAMLTAGAAMQLRDLTVIPVGELAFSTTLALMIFSNKRDGEVPFLHIGAVTGFLTYIILFGIPV